MQPTSLSGGGAPPMTDEELQQYLLQQAGSPPPPVAAPVQANDLYGQPYPPPSSLPTTAPAPTAPANAPAAANDLYAQPAPAPSYAPGPGAAQQDAALGSYLQQSPGVSDVYPTPPPSDLRGWQPTAGATSPAPLPAPPPAGQTVATPYAPGPGAAQQDAALGAYLAQNPGVSSAYPARPPSELRGWQPSLRATPAALPAPPPPTAASIPLPPSGTPGDLYGAQPIYSPGPGAAQLDTAFSYYLNQNPGVTRGFPARPPSEMRGPQPNWVGMAAGLPAPPPATSMALPMPPAGTPGDLYGTTPNYAPGPGAAQQNASLGGYLTQNPGVGQVSTALPPSELRGWQPGFQQSPPSAADQFALGLLADPMASVTPLSSWGAMASAPPVRATPPGAGATWGQMAGAGPMASTVTAPPPSIGDRVGPWLGQAGNALLGFIPGQAARGAVVGTANNPQVQRAVGDVAVAGDSALLQTGGTPSDQARMLAERTIRPQVTGMPHSMDQSPPQPALGAWDGTIRPWLAQGQYVGPIFDNVPNNANEIGIPWGQRPSTVAAGEAPPPAGQVAPPPPTAAPVAKSGKAPAGTPIDLYGSALGAPSGQYNPFVANLGFNANSKIPGGIPVRGDGVSVSGADQKVMVTRDDSGGLHVMVAAYGKDGKPMLGGDGLPVLAEAKPTSDGGWTWSWIGKGGTAPAAATGDKTGTPVDPNATAPAAAAGVAASASTGTGSGSGSGSGGSSSGSKGSSGSGKSSTWVDYPKSSGGSSRSSGGSRSSNWTDYGDSGGSGRRSSGGGYDGGGSSYAPAARSSRRSSGQSADLNGDGRIDATERMAARRSRSRRMGRTMPTGPYTMPSGAMRDDLMTEIAAHFPWARAKMPAPPPAKKPNTKVAVGGTNKAPGQVVDRKKE